MKALFIFPPTWTTYSISTGIPQIMGYLSKRGYTDVEALDLNIKFFRFFYNKSKLQAIFNDLKNKRVLLYKELYKNKGKKNKEQTKKKVLFAAYYEFIKEHEHGKLINEDINNIETLIKKFKSNRIHKNLESLLKASSTIVEINHLININLIDNTFINSNEYIDFIEKNQNPLYIEFFSSIADKIVKANYDYIGFSVNCKEQSIASLILIKMLKERGIKSRICFGGSETFSIKPILLTDKRYYKEYIDYAMIGAGEHPTAELFEYLEGKRKIEDVSGIIYMNNENQIIENEPKQILDNDFVISSYNGYDFSEYTLPEHVIPIRTSFGCYWGKCTFCDYNSITKYEKRTVDSVIEEIKYYIKKYKINNFYFVDAALPPSFLKEFSEKILKEKIKIYYYTNLRFEKEFTKEFLKQLYDSGLRCCGWGLESASPRILKLMNKGTNTEIITRILVDAYNIGILNHIYYIYGFPSETEEDFDKTYNFFKDNKQYISSVAEHAFILHTNSYIFSHPEEFEIDKEKLEKLMDEIGNQTFISWKNDKIQDGIKYYKPKIIDIQDFIFEKGSQGIGFEEMVLYSKYKNSKSNWFSTKLNTLFNRLP